MRAVLSLLLVFMCNVLLVESNAYNVQASSHFLEKSRLDGAGLFLFELSTNAKIENKVDPVIDSLASQVYTFFAPSVLLAKELFKPIHFRFYQRAIYIFLCSFLR